MKVTKEDMPVDATAFSRACIPYVEVDIIGDFDLVLKNVLSGVTCLFVEGYEACIAIDCRTYPARSVEEPDKDKSLRGSRDGFVETIVFKYGSDEKKDTRSAPDHGDDGSGRQFPHGCSDLLHGGPGG